MPCDNLLLLANTSLLPLTNIMLVSLVWVTVSMCFLIPLFIHPCETDLLGLRIGYGAGVISWLAFLGGSAVAFQYGFTRGVVLLTGPAITSIAFLLVMGRMSQDCIAFSLRELFAPITSQSQITLKPFVIAAAVPVALIICVNAYCLFIVARDSSYSQCITSTVRSLAAFRDADHAVIETTRPIAGTLRPGAYIILESLSPFSDTPGSSFVLAAESPLPSPQSVTHVAAIVGTTHIGRTYAPGGVDRNWTFNCYIVDITSGVVVSVSTFHGEIPGDRTGSPAGLGPTFGEKPWRQVRKWVYTASDQYEEDNIDDLSLKKASADRSLAIHLLGGNLAMLFCIGCGVTSTIERYARRAGPLRIVAAISGIVCLYCLCVCFAADSERQSLHDELEAAVQSV